MDWRVPGLADGPAILFEERLGVGAHAQGMNAELSRDRGPCQAPNDARIADEMGGLCRGHGGEYLVKRCACGDHDRLHARCGRHIEQRGARVRRDAGLQHAKSAGPARLCARRSSRAWTRQARQATDTKNCQSHTYTPRTPLEPPELKIC